MDCYNSRCNSKASCQKYPASKLVKFALPLTSLGLLLLLYPKVFPNLAGNSNYLYLVLPVFAIFNGIVTPNLIGLVSNSADPKEQGEVLGINASIGSLAQAIPPILAAYIANISNELPLIVGAGVIFVAFLIFATSYKEQKFKIEEWFQVIDTSKSSISNNEFNGKFKLSTKTIAKEVLKELKARLGFLNSVGLSYLTLSRTARTLSGGEAQRIRLASQIGSGLTGVLYILDEPSIGLHQKIMKGYSKLYFIFET